MAHGSDYWHALEEALRQSANGGAGQAPAETMQRAANGMRELRERLDHMEREQASWEQAFHDMRASEERWRSIVQNPFDFVVVCDRNGLIQYLNRTDPAAGPVEEIVGKRTIYEFTEVKSHDTIRAALEQVFERGRPAYYETYSPMVDSWFGTVVGPIEHNGRIETASLLAREINAQKKVELALRESEERFRQLAECIDDVFFLFEPASQRTLYVSPAYERVWGRPLQQVYVNSRAWLEAVHPEDRDEIARNYERLRSSSMEPSNGDYKFAAPAEFRVVQPNGTVRWVRSRTFPIFDDNGGVTRVVGAVSDVTEHRKAAQALLAAEAKYRVLVERLPVISYIASLGESRNTIYISPQIEAKLGFTQDEWLADTELWQKRIHPSDRARVMAELREMQRCGDRLHSVYRMLTREGEVLWFRDEAVLVPDKSGSCALAEGVMLDVSEAEEARAEQLRAQALSAHLVAVQEAERQRIARELHDEIGQTLTGLKLMLEMVAERNEPAGQLAEARNLVQDLMERARNLSLELRPSMLDDLGLLPTLQAMFERIERQTGLRIEFKHQSMQGRFDANVETTAYRLVQEALTNIARHADVEEASVRAWSDAESLSLEVHDLGVGFDIDEALTDYRKNGLVGMRERVAVLGGKLELESKLGAGTRLKVEIPIQRGEGLVGDDGGES